MMRITLLTHERETRKASNTGQVVMSVLGESVERIIWNRTSADEQLKTALETGSAILLYPDEPSKEETDGAPSAETAPDRTSLDKVSHLVVLDGTWQETRKMLRKSDYLKTAKRISVKTNQPSNYRLRRNQLPEGMCTAESIACFLRQTGHSDWADKIERELEAFQQHYYSPPK